MEAFVIHLIKTAALANLFLLVYILLLKNDTSFSHNRRFLIAGILSSVFLPFAQFTRKVEVQNTTFQNFLLPENPGLVATNETLDFSWWQIAAIFYFLGLALFCIRLLLQIFTLYKSTRQLPSKRQDGFVHLISSEETTPFSFFNFIVFNPEMHSPEELKMILLHEEAHVRQWHTLDVLLMNLFCVLVWFNPLNSSYRKNLVQNLEYLADKDVVSKVKSKKIYQKTLLKVSFAAIQPALINQFNQSFIKKRIIMLNKRSTKEMNPIKAAVIFPLIFLFMLSFNVKTEAREVLDNSPSPTETLSLNKNYLQEIHGNSPEDDLVENGSDTFHSAPTLTAQQKPPLVVVNGQVKGEDYDVNSLDPLNIGSVNVLKGDLAIEKYGEKGKYGVIEITTKSKKESTEARNTEKQLKGNHATATSVRRIEVRESGTSGEQEAFSISITGAGSTETGDLDALIVVDGKIMGDDFDMESIAPSNIDHISVLKGTTATDKYGEAAKKGVVEITTKK